MTAPVRERLMQAILSATGGEWGLPVPEDERDVPLTLVQDDMDGGAQTAYGVTTLVMPVNVSRFEEVASQDRDAQRAQAHEALKVVVAAMFVDATFDGLATGLEYVGGGVEVVGQLAYARCSFRVTYRHLRGDTTALPVV